jgi:PAS domain S-box-containing protein
MSVQQNNNSLKNNFMGDARHLNTLDDLLEGCQVIGYDWRYLYVNRVAARQGHREPEELLHHTMMEMYPGIENTELFTVMRDCMINRVAHQMVNNFTYPDGTNGWFELSIQSVPEGIFILSVDITQRKRAENKVIQLSRLYATLSQVNQTIVRVKEPGELYRSICNVAVEYGKFDLAWIGLLDESTGEIEPSAANGLDVAQWPFQTVNINQDPFKDGLIATAIRSSQVCLSNDIQVDHRNLFLQEQYREFVFHASAVVPFTLNGKPLGILNLVSCQPYIFTDDEELNLLNEMGTDISFALASIQTENKRKQAMEQLLESEKRFHSIYENITIGIYRTTLDGRILMANPALVQMMGYDSFEDLALRNLELEGFEAGFERKKFQLEIETKGEIRGFESGWTKKDGTSFFVRESAKAIRDGTGNILYYEGTIEDITDRKRSEIALKASEENYRSLVENSESAIAVLDQDGRVLYANSWAINVWNDPKIVGKTTYQIYPEEYAKIYLKAIRKVLHAQTTIIDEVETLINDRMMWFRISMSPLRNPAGIVDRVLLNAWDITDRKQTDEELLFRNVLLSTQQEASIDGILVVDENANILSYNQRFIELWGVPAELLDSGDDQPVLEFVTTSIQDQVSFLERVQYLYAHPHETSHDEIIVTDGRVIERYSAPMFGPNERYFGRVWYFRDITDRKQAEAELLASEEKYRSLIESSNSVITAIDFDGYFHFANQIAATQLGCEPVDIIGKNMKDLFPPEIADRQLTHIRQVITNGESFVSEAPNIINGQTRWFLSNIQPVRDSSGQMLLAMVNSQDITERKQAEKRLHLQLKRMNALSEIDRAIASSLDMRVSLDVLLTQVLSQLGVDAATILSLSTYDQTLVYRLGKGFRTPVSSQSRVRLGEGLAGRVGLERKLLHTPDLAAAGESFTRMQLFKGEGFKEYFGVPLIAKGMLKGVLEIYHRDSLDPDLEWFNYLETLGGQAAIAIDNAQLFEGMQQSNLELVTAYDATIEGWSHALDLRDKETEGHSQRVTELTLRLAEKMGVKPGELVNIRRGALLHDIGKLGVPDHILFKPDALNEDEWESMRQHPTYAYNMLMPIKYLNYALDIPYCHHEKWDGTGYPRGLKGEQIPLAARIFAVVDVWDALRSDRPYRSGWSSEQARKHIFAQSGKHFDPRVVECFMRMLDEE